MQLNCITECHLNEDVSAIQSVLNNYTTYQEKESIPKALWTFNSVIKRCKVFTHQLISNMTVAMFRDCLCLLKVLISYYRGDVELYLLYTVCTVHTLCYQTVLYGYINQ